MNYQELEIKLLDINKEDIESKLLDLGANKLGEAIQKIYTYDCYDPILMYRLSLLDYKITKSNNSLMKIVNVLSQLKPIINDNDKEVFKRLTGYDYLEDYILNSDSIDEDILNNKEIENIITSTKDRFFKWIRLRQTNDVVELTIKYIYNTNSEYNIDEVKEVEIKVDNFDTANKLIEEMGYFRKKLVEKKRTSYKLGNNSIEIDEWPLIKPYVEIEGVNVDEIYNLAKELGYDKENTYVMNTEDVYLKEGIDLTSFEELTFNSQVKAK